MGIRTGAGSDYRIRVRIFAYLRANGVSVVDANVVARKLVFAMVGKGALSESTATLAGAAVANPVPGETKSAVLVEPKAEPYEFGWPSFGGKSEGVSIDGLLRQTPGGFKVPGRPGGKTGAVEVGGLDCSTTANLGKVAPLISRFEVRAHMSATLGQAEVLSLAREAKKVLAWPT